MGLKVAHEKKSDFGFLAQSMVEKKKGYMIVVTTTDMEVEFSGAGQR
jgi:hypothetical protein